ncbi:hypothetical protein DPMN_154063 [Dreissena polymorpha]|uniref:Uncharacterized protein n=1 Tax=Dreissena polymorpha TaxID=45954 RepID=A0A9D4FQ20_DREPO|nr:hypothetical protein DPMN_154063 [Dreissena polymorpha]
MFSDFDKPIVVVLASDVKVFWHVRIQNQPEQLQQHTFIVSTRPCDILYTHSPASAAYLHF